MGVKKFIENVKVFLELDEFKKSSKKKSIQALLKKLNIKKEEIHTSLEKVFNEKEKNLLEEELAIILIHIKNGEEILDKLNR